MIQKLSIYQVKNLLSSKKLYLAEDCNSLVFIDYKKGLEITLERLANLEKYDFPYLWVSDDVSLFEQEVSKADTIKRELFFILSRHMPVFYENDLRQNLKYIEPNDLLRYPLEILQLDGAFLLLRKILGVKIAEFINRVQALLVSLYNELGHQPGLFGHICLGNLYKNQLEGYKKPNFGSFNGKEVYERSNYIVQLSVLKTIAYISTLRNIQSYRKKKEFGLYRKLDRETKRGLYLHEEVIESILAVFFSEYGLAHLSVDKIVVGNTKNFLKDDGKNTEEESGKNLGFAFLDSLSKSVLSKHANVSYNLFYMRRKGFCNDLGRNILRFHHRGLVEGEDVVPSRKFEKKSTFNDGKESFYQETSIKIEELTRLAYISSFFVEYLFQMPLHLPCSRDLLVRFLLENSEYPKNKSGSLLDPSIYGLETQYLSKNNFDGYLVKMFLKSIQIYMIGEKVPIFYLNYKQKYDAVIYEYNEMPHRPVVEIISPGDFFGKLIDLSSEENNNLRIGEYLPTIDLEKINEYIVEKRNPKKKKPEKKDDKLKDMLDEYLLEKTNEKTQKNVFLETDFINFKPFLRERSTKKSVDLSFEKDIIDNLTLDPINLSIDDEDELKVTNKNTDPIENQEVPLEKQNIDFYEADSFSTEKSNSSNLERMVKLDVNNQQPIKETITETPYLSKEVQTKENEIVNKKQDEDKLEENKSLYYIYIYIEYLADYIPYGIGIIYSSFKNIVRVKLLYLAKQDYIAEDHIYYKFLKIDNNQKNTLINIHHPGEILNKSDHSYYIIYSKLKSEDKQDITTKLQIEYKYKNYKLKYSYHLLMSEDNDPKYLIKIDNNEPSVAYIVRSVLVENNKVKFTRTPSYNRKIAIKGNSKVKIGKRLSISEMFEYFQLESMI